MTSLFESKIKAQALASAMAHHLSEMPPAGKEEEALSALANTEEDTCRALGIVVWQPFEHESLSAVAERIKSAAETEEAELLMAVELYKESVQVADKTTIPVGPWNSAQYGASDEEKEFDFTISVSDQRVSNGQVYIDVADKQKSESGALSLIVEIGSNNRPVVHLHMDDSQKAATLCKIGDGNISVELEDGIKLDYTGNGKYQFVGELSGD